RMLARGRGQADDIPFDGIAGMDVLNRGLHREQLRGVQDRVQVNTFLSSGPTSRSNLPLFLWVRIAYAQAHNKAIKLSFGEWIGPLELDWILGGHHHKRLGYRVFVPL